jgi:hypothetical protein
MRPPQARDGAGRTISPASVVLPVMEEVGPGQLRVIGTGFYITRYGLLATARHVLEDLCHPGAKMLKVAYLFQQDDEGRFARRRIVAASLSNTADVGVAQAINWIDGDQAHTAPPNRRAPLSFDRPSPGERLVTYAYPENKVLDFRDPNHVPTLRGDYFLGKFHREVPSRAHPYIPYPHFETSLEIRGGASGCPIFNSKGRVVAIACRGWDFRGGDHDGSNLSLVIPVSFLLPLETCARIPTDSWEYSELPPSRRASGLTFGELVTYGHVDVGTFGGGIRVDAGRLSWASTRGYWEKRPLRVVIVVALTLGSPFVGLFIAGWAGVAVGVVVSVVTLFLSVRAITRARETTNSG